MIVNLQKYGEYGWIWEIRGRTGYFYTTKMGEGIFYDDPERGVFRKQITGLCQFSACRTYSGMRRKLLRYFGE